MRINGIGATLLGISAPDEFGNSTATTWFTFIYLPLIPVGRMTVRFLEHKGSGFSYTIIKKEKLVLTEIFRTYLFGWILFPLMIFGPAAIVQKGIWETLGLPEAIHIPFGVVAVIWVFAACLKLDSWHEAKCRAR